MELEKKAIYKLQLGEITESILNYIKEQGHELPEGSITELQFQIGESAGIKQVEFGIVTVTERGE